MKFEIFTELAASQGVFAILPVLIVSWDEGLYSINVAWMKWGFSIALRKPE